MYSLSVIVPIYNAEKHLVKTLESLAAQTVADSMQIILVDDGSADASPAICDEFASKRPDTVVIHRKNGGVSAARNAGIREASGEYIGFVDADDTVAPDYFEKLLTAAKENDCDMAFSSIHFIYNGEHRIPAEWYPAGTVLEHSDILSSFARKMLSDGIQNSACVKIFRRCIVEEHSISFPIGIKIAEDKRFVLDFLSHCERAVYAGDCGYFYLSVPTSAMHSGKKMQELLSTDEDEMNIFISLGLDKDTVRTEKSAFLFYELADFFQRCYTSNNKDAKATIQQHFANAELMKKIDYAVPFIKANEGKIYSLLITAFSKRSVSMTLAVLFIQKLINERNA